MRPENNAVDPPPFISDFPLPVLPSLSLDPLPPAPMSLPTPVSAAESSSSTLVSAPSDLPFSPPCDSRFVFPPPDVLDHPIDTTDGSPDTPADPHLLVVGDMLKKWVPIPLPSPLAQILPPSIAQTAQSARTACSLGQGLEANARIDELRKTIALVSELIAATQIADPPPGSRRSSPRRFSTLSGLSIPISAPALTSPTRHPPGATVQDTSQPLLLFSSGHADLTVVDSQITSDTSDLSRKRCASSMAGDRALKAPKMEPQEDILHIMSQPVATAPSFPPTAVPSLVPFVPTNPPPEPASRPTSSAGLAQGAFNVLSTTPGMAFSIPATSAPTSSVDFVSASSTVVHPAHFPPSVRSSWSDGTASIPPRTHQHSLSASSLTSGISFQSIPSTSAGLSPLPFSSTGSFATASTHSRPVTVGGAGISPPIGRVSRSGSFTNNNTFTFGLPEVPPVTGALDFLQPSLSMSMANLAAHSPTSSQEGDFDFDFDSDGGDCSQSHSPESSSGNNPRFPTQTQVSRPVTVHNSRSNALLTQKSMENLPAPNHANEVPQEYRAEVDRIFFEFLNIVCSNRKPTQVRTIVPLTQRVCSRSDRR